MDTSVNAPTNAEGEKLEGEGGQAETVPDTEFAQPENPTKSYDAYLAEQAEKRLNLGGVLEARKANEGSKVDKKWASAKALNKDEEEESYFAGKEAKAPRQRERKEKQTIEIDHRFQEQSRGERGGRGRGGRGEFRGDRGGRGGRGRGDFRGGRGGGRGRDDNVNISDKSAFPSLGA